MACVLAIAAAGCSAPAEEDVEVEDSALKNAAEEELAAGTGVDWIVDIDASRGTPDLAAPTTEPPVYVRRGESYRAAALRFLAEYDVVFKGRSAQGKLTAISEEKDERGAVHVRIAHVLAIPGEPHIEDSGYVVHFTKAGAVAFVNGTFDPKAFEERPDEVGEAAPVRDGEWASAEGAALVVTRLRDGRRVLAWAMKGDGAGSLETVYVDTKSGAIVKRVDRMRDVEARGKGVRYYPPISDLSDIKTIEVSTDASGYRLHRTGRAGIPALRTCRPSTVDDVEPTPIASVDGLEWDTSVASVPGGGAGAAVDAHLHTAQALDWYHEKLDWHEFDQLETGIVVEVHVKGGWGAVYGGGRIVASDGDIATGGERLPAVSLSILAHELSHGVTAVTKGMGFSEEPGEGIDESLADVFSAMVVRDVRGEGDALLIGADASLSGKPIRDMLHPSKGRRRTEKSEDGVPCNFPNTPPDHYSKRYKGTCDSGGSHLNAGISNNAFALMTVGGINDTSKIEVTRPLGWERSRALWWTSQRHVLLPTANFSMLARWQIATASSLGLDLHAVACAWVATGVVDASYAARWRVRC